MGSMRRFGLLVATAGAIGGCTTLLGDFSFAPSNVGGDDGGTEGGAGDAATDSGGGGGEAGSDGGDAGSLHCTTVTKYQRPIPSDGGTVTADGLWIFNDPSADYARGAVKGSNDGDSFAFAMRTDRFENAETFLLTKRARNMERAADDTSTYAVALDDNLPDGGSNLNVFKWDDNNSGFQQNVFASTSFPSNNSPGSADITSTPSGLFYLMTNGVATYASAGGATPDFSHQISTVSDTGIGDGGRLYTLSDGSVSAVVYEQGASGPEPHQLHFPAGSATPSNDRVFPGGSKTMPIGFAKHGTQVDVALAIPDDAGTSFTLHVGAVDESKLFTFTLSDLKPLPLSTLNITTKPCFSLGGGSFTVLSPNATAGLDMVIVDTSTATIGYLAAGAANLLTGDTNILTCGVSPPRNRLGVLTYDLVWTVRSGNTALLTYAPIACSKQ